MTLVALVIALVVVILYKANVGEETASLLGEIAGDPNLDLPPSVTGVDAGPWESDGAAVPEPVRR